MTHHTAFFDENCASEPPTDFFHSIGGKRTLRIIVTGYMEFGKPASQPRITLTRWPTPRCQSTRHLRRSNADQTKIIAARRHFQKARYSGGVNLSTRNHQVGNFGLIVR